MMEVNRASEQVIVIGKKSYFLSQVEPITDPDECSSLKYDLSIKLSEIFRNQKKGMGQASNEPV